MAGGTKVQTSLSGGQGGTTGAQTTGRKVYNIKSIPPWLIAVIVIVPCGALAFGLWLWFNRKKKG